MSGKTITIPFYEPAQAPTMPGSDPAGLTPNLLQLRMLVV